MLSLILTVLASMETVKFKTIRKATKPNPAAAKGMIRARYEN